MFTEHQQQIYQFLQYDYAAHHWFSSLLIFFYKIFS